MPMLNASRAANQSRGFPSRKNHDMAVVGQRGCPRDASPLRTTGQLNRTRPSVMQSTSVRGHWCRPWRWWSSHATSSPSPETQPFGVEAFEASDGLRCGGWAWPGS